MPRLIRLLRRLVSTPENNPQKPVRGEPINEDVARAAGEVAIQGARPLRHNEYKIPLLRNLVMRAIRDAQVQ